MSKPQKWWAQGDCVQVEARSGPGACQEYRRLMSEARIGISTYRPDGLRVRELAAALRRIIDGAARIGPSGYLTCRWCGYILADHDHDPECPVGIARAALMLPRPRSGGCERSRES